MQFVFLGTALLDWWHSKVACVDLTRAVAAAPFLCRRDEFGARECRPHFADFDSSKLARAGLGQNYQHLGQSYKTPGLSCRLHGVYQLFTFTRSLCFLARWCLWTGGSWTQGDLRKNRARPRRRRNCCSTSPSSPLCLRKCSPTTR